MRIYNLIVGILAGQLRLVPRESLHDYTELALQEADPALIDYLRGKGVLAPDDEALLQAISPRKCPPHR